MSERRPSRSPLAAALAAAEQTSTETAALTVELGRLLTGARFRFGNEDDLQRAIAEALDHGFDGSYRREVRLTARDRIDFLVDGGVGIEVKVGGNTDSLRRQLARYAEHEAIEALLVVTTQRRHMLALPEQVAGKPVLVAYVGGPGL